MEEAKFLGTKSLQPPLAHLETSAPFCLLEFCKSIKTSLNEDNPENLCHELL